MLLTIEQFCPMEVVQVGKRKPEIIAVRRRYPVEVPQVRADQVEMSIRWSNVGLFKDRASQGVRFAVGGAGCYEALAPQALNRDAGWIHLIPGGHEFPWPQGEPGRGMFFEHMPAVRHVVRDYDAEVAAAMQRLAGAMVTDGQRILRPAVEPHWTVHCMTSGQYNLFGFSVTAPNYDGVTLNAFRFDDVRGAIDFAVERGAGRDHLQWAAQSAIEIPKPELLQFDPQQFHVLAVARQILWVTVGHLAELTTPQLTAYGRLRDKVREWQKDPMAAPTSDVVAAVAEAWTDLSIVPLIEHKPAMDGYRASVESVLAIQQASEDEFEGLSGAMTP